MKYLSLEQRMADSYRKVFPPFVPDNIVPVSVADQQWFYDIIKNLYQLAYDEPLLFVPALNEDDAYPYRSLKSAYGKPKLQISMNKFTKTMDAFLRKMFQLGQGTEISFSKRESAVLQKLGVGDFTSLPPGWIWMATRPNADLYTFSHCHFSKGYFYTSDVYSRILGETAFRGLGDWMISHGYQRFDIPVGLAAGYTTMSLVYANPLWSKALPRGDSHYKVKHTGICVNYNPCFDISVELGLCIPGGLMKAIIESFDVMSAGLKKFFMKHVAKCWNCKYCIQTDKTGKRPMAYIPTVYEEKSHNLCTYYPGYGFRWTNLDDSLAEELMEMLAFMDGLWT
ncbi:MAG: hypothetical protein FWC73_10340 [Defluviitaleaceae bacterium]|nr:hypothetical protein [Defluviitaleaceae bacterium]